MSDEQRLFRAPAVDGIQPDDSIVKIAGAAGQVFRPLRFDDDAVLLVRGRVTKVGFTRKIEDGEPIIVRTATVEPEFTYLLDHRGQGHGLPPTLDDDRALLVAAAAEGVAGLINVAAGAAARDRDIAAGVTALPLAAYREE